MHTHIYTHTHILWCPEGWDVRWAVVEKETRGGESQSPHICIFISRQFAPQAQNENKQNKKTEKGRMECGAQQGSRGCTGVRVQGDPTGPGRVSCGRSWGFKGWSCFLTFPGVKHRAILENAGLIRVSHSSVGFVTVGSFYSPGKADPESECRMKLSNGPGLWRGWGRTHGKYQVFILIYYYTVSCGSSVGCCGVLLPGSEVPWGMHVSLGLFPFSKGPLVSLF